MRRAPLVMLLATAASWSRAAVVDWEGGNLPTPGDGLRWADPLNWQGDALPLLTDDVTFGAPGTGGSTVHLGTNRTLNSLGIDENVAIGALGSNLLLTNATGNISVAGGVQATLHAAWGGSNGLNLSGGGSLYLTNTLSPFSGHIAVDGAGTTLIHRQEGPSVQYNGVNSAQDYGRFDPVTLGFTQQSPRNITLTNGGTYRIIGTGNDAEGNFKNIVIGAGGGTLDLAPGYLVQLLNDAGQLSAGTNAFTKAGNGRLIISGTLADANSLGGVVNVNDGTFSLERLQAGAGAGTRFAGIAATGTTVNINNGGTLLLNGTTQGRLDVPTVNLNDGGILAVQGNNHIVGLDNGSTTLNTSGTATILTRDHFTPQTSRFQFWRNTLTGSGTLDLIGGTGAGAAPRLVIERGSASTFSGVFRLQENTSLEANPRFNTPANVGKVIADGDIEFAGWGGTLDLRDSNPAAAMQLGYTTNDIRITTTQPGAINTITVNRGDGGTGTGHQYNLGGLTLGNHRLAFSGGNNYSSAFTGMVSMNGDATFLGVGSPVALLNASALSEDIAGRTLNLVKTGVGNTPAADTTSGGVISVSNLNIQGGGLHLRGANGAIGFGAGGGAPRITLHGGTTGSTTGPAPGLLHLDGNGTVLGVAAANNNNRIATGALLNMRGNSTLRLTSNNNTATSETIENVFVSGHGLVDVVKTGTPAAPVVLDLPIFAMTGTRPTANFTGTALGIAGTDTSRIVLGGMATGFMGSEFHSGDEWAKYDTALDNGVALGVTPFVAADYTIGTGEATWAAGQQIKQNGATLPTLTFDRVADRFNFQTTAGNQALDLAGFTLTANQGGFLSSAQTIGIVDGPTGAVPSGTAGITSSTGVVNFHNNAQVDLRTPVVGSVDFVKSGIGNLRMIHQDLAVGGGGALAAPFTANPWTSTLTGSWVVNDGILETQRGEFLGGRPLVLNGGTFFINEPVANANSGSILTTYGNDVTVNSNVSIVMDDNGESHDTFVGGDALVRMGSLTINNGAMLSFGGIGNASASSGGLPLTGAEDMMFTGTTLNGRTTFNLGVGRGGSTSSLILRGALTGTGFDVVAFGGSATSLVLGGGAMDAIAPVYSEAPVIYGGTLRLNKANSTDTLLDLATPEDVVINNGSLYWGPGSHGDLITSNNVNTANNGLTGLHPLSPPIVMAGGQDQIADTANVTLLYGTLGESDRITNERFGTLTMKNGTMNVGLGTITMNSATISGGAIGFDRGGTWNVGSLTYLPGAPDQNVFTGRPVPGAYTTLAVGPGGLSMTGQYMTIGSGYYGSNVMGAGGRIVLGGDLTYNGTDLIAGSNDRKGLYIATGASFREIGGSHLDLAGGSRNFDIDTDSIFTVTLPVRNGAITKTGGGSLVLEPYQASTFSGVTVNGGMVVAKGDGALGGVGMITVNPGGTVKLETGWDYPQIFSVVGGGSALPGAPTILEAGAVVADGGTSRLRNTFMITGDTTVAGTNFLDPSVAPGTGGAAWRIGRLSIESPNGILGSGNLTLSGDGDGLVVNGVNTMAGGLNKDGAGRWTILRGSSYVGPTTIAAGHLRIMDNGALGNPGAGTTVLGGTLELLGMPLGGGGGGLSLAEPLRINGAGASSQSGAIVNVGGNNTLTGPLLLASSATLRSNAGILDVDIASSVIGTPGSALTLSGAASGNINAKIALSNPGDDVIVKAGTGSWFLGNATNAFTGSVRVDGGRLTVVSGYDATQPLRMNGGHFQNLAAGGTVNGVQLLSGGGTVTTFPTFNLGAITASPGATGNFQGVLSATNPNINGIIGVFATNSMLGGPEWNKTNAGMLQPLLPGDYSAFPAPAAAGAAPTITDTLNTSLGYDGLGYANPVTGAISTSTLRVVSGLKGLNAGAAPITLDNSGIHGAGGLLVQQAPGSTFNIGGTGLLSAGSPNNDLYIHAWGDTAISNPLIGAGTGSLIKAGTGDLRLFGSSDFTGSIYVNGGNLIVPGGIGTPGVLGAAPGGGQHRLININGGGFGITSDWDINDFDVAPGNQSYQLNIGPAGGTLLALYGANFNINDGSATSTGAEQQLRGSGDLTLAGGGRYNFTAGTPQFLNFGGNVTVDGGVLMVGHSNTFGGRQEQVITLNTGSAIINSTGFGLGQNGLPNNIVAGSPLTGGGVEFFSQGGNRVFGGDIQLHGTNTIYLAERDAPNQERQLYFNGRVSGTGVTLDVYGANNGNPFYLASGANDLTGDINLKANAVLEARQPGSIGIGAGDVNINLDGANSRLLLRHWQNGDYRANVNVNAAAEINSDRLTGYGGGTSQLLSINNLTTSTDNILSIGGGNSYTTRVGGIANFKANTPVNTGGNILFENGINFTGVANTLDKRGGASLILRGAADHAGPTIVQQGTLILMDGGTLPNTNNIALRGGELRVDNSTFTNTDRLNNGATVSLGGGILRLTGNEVLGTVTAESGTTQVINNPIHEAVPNPLTLTGFTRQTGSVLQFQVPDSGATGAVGMTSFGQTRVGSRILIPGQADTTQTIPGFLGNNSLDFIQYDGTTLDNGAPLGVRDMRNPGNVNSPANYVNDPAEGAWNDTVIARLTGTSTTTLAANRALDAIKIEGGAARTIALAGFNLRIEGGGILAVGNTSVISGAGNLYAGSSVATPGTAELFFGGNNTTTVSSVISNNPESGQNVAVVKTGTGTTNINGANTYTGGTFVTSGTLNTTNANGFGNAPNPITLSGGTLVFNIAGGTNVDLGMPDHPVNVRANSQITLDNGTGGTDNNISLGALNIPGPYTLRLFSYDSMDASFTGTHTFAATPTIDMMQAGSGGDRTGFFTISGDITGSGFNVGSSGASNNTTSVLQIGGGEAVHNTYTGTVRVLFGVGSTGSETDNLRVELNKAAGFNAISGDLEINGGIVRNIADQQIADTGNMTLNWGSYEANGRTETLASITQNGGSLRTGAGVVTVTGDYTITGLDDISGGGGDGIQINSNGTLNVGGTLRMTNLGRATLGASAAALNLNSLEMTGATITQNSGGGNNTIHLNGDVTTFASPHPARLGNSNDSDTYLELNGVRSFNVADGSAGLDLELSSVVRDSTTPANSGGIYKTGTGTMQLQGGATGNTYTGMTTVSRGDLVLFKSGGTTAIPGSLTIADGNGPARVTVRNSNQIADASAVTIDNDGVLDLATFNTVEKVGNLSSNIGGLTLLGPASALEVDITANTTYAGSINGGGATAGAVIKGGTATWLLTGSSEYAGDTVVNAGTLQVDGFLNGSTTRVATGGTLAGIGTVSDVVVNGGGTFAPGASPGIITTRSVGMLSGSFANIEIGGLTPGNGSGFHDQIISRGDINLDGTLVVSLVNLYVPNQNDKFLIWTNDLADAVTGNFTGLPEGATFPVPETGDPSDYWQISYVEGVMAGSDGNDIRLQYIPEPGTAFLAAAAASLLLFRRRRGA